MHLLTVGRYTYTSDQRFSAHHVPLTHFWQLRIRNVTFDDEGRYECQISTTPPLGHALDLTVVGECYIPHIFPIFVALWRKIVHDFYTNTAFPLVGMFV